MEKVLVLVPHADDEVLGFGGAIATHVERKDEVHVAVIKEHISTRRSRLQFCSRHSAQQVLLYDHFYNQPLDLNDFNLCVNWVEHLLVTVEPTTLYIPHPSDSHQDHAAVFNIARVATRIHGHYKVPKILCGEIPSSTYNTFNVDKSFKPNYYVGLSERALNKKIEAMTKYVEELREFPHPRSAKGIETFALMRGMECGLRFAEAFECLRYINT